MSDDDTIYALASGALPSAIAIIRFSGTQTKQILQQLNASNSINHPKQAQLTWLKYDTAIIDQAMVSFFPAPDSYTGEDYAEFHLHGSVAVLNRLFAILQKLPCRVASCRLAPCRLALPGEFTKRAFLNDKIDLTQAEAINDLIMAQSDAQHQLAVNQMQGKLGQYYHDVKQRLIYQLAHIEAAIDFAEDEDFSDSVTKTHIALQAINAEIETHLDDNQQGEHIREGIKVALIGPPNTGKSTLLNYLAQNDIAITTPIAGTTRDILNVNLNIAGYAVIVSDSAGIRDSNDEIEQEGIRRSKQLAKQANIIINIAAIDGEGNISRLDETFEGNVDIYLLNKIDLYPNHQQNSHNMIAVSLLQNDGLVDFLGKLTELIELKMRDDKRDSPYITRQRYRDILFHVKQELESSIRLCHEQSTEIELIAEHLRRAIMQMGKLTGHVDVESLLDIIFKDFCIGK